MEDGEFESKFQSGDIPFEYDLMYTIPVRIQRESQLQFVSNGYYKIYYVQSLSHLPHNNQYINGFKLKEEIRSNIEKYCPRPLKSLTSVHEASIYIQYDNGSDKDILNKIEYFRQSLVDDERKQHEAQKNLNLFFRFCSDILEKKCTEYISNLSQDVFNMRIQPDLLEKQYKRMLLLIRVHQALFSSLIGNSLPKNLADRVRAVLNFYENYKHLIVDDHMKQVVQKCIAKSSLEECDIVIGLKLDFIPSASQSSFERIKQNRPNLYKKLKSYLKNVYLIPKCSSKTAQEESAYEFRLSFSVIESKIAELRTKSEKMLNGIARSIYYKYLHRTKLYVNEQYIKSYVIKTIVLWLCEKETNDINRQDVEDNDENKSNFLTKLFLDHILKTLEQKRCPHYFDEQTNLLEEYDFSFLDRVYEVLARLKIPEKHSVVQAQKVPSMSSMMLEFVKQTPEIVEEFNELQIHWFYNRSQLYVPQKYSWALNHTFCHLYYCDAETNDWLRMMKRIMLMDANDAYHNDDIDIEGICVEDICDAVEHLNFTVVNHWSLIKQIMSDNDGMRYLFSLRRSLLTYTINIGNRWVYARFANNMKTATLAKILLNGHGTHLPDKLFNSGPMNTTGCVKDMYLLHVDLDGEQHVCSRQQVLDQFWLDNFAPQISDFIYLICCGYANAKFVIGDRSTDAITVQSCFGRISRAVRLIRGFQKMDLGNR
ncbi:unnamed protein product [Didymodactylos carnosus]|uniref:Mab-21-like HhH/H2TH-like domain-containing protein n=1 Tax=Didymodactylos carnosus TaxID=1234261 RepID=A0A815JVV5_9BILA|nr:unnamed protein product [Didymodactylos carnosus]CAF1381789.1 unnamed protein product [Didymodactylos carnosus]CAF4039738.1 unnamed protein product [Didymodactylos carnosus]CAF4277108.1 unnamed protein product [Didymodactylos carnosus]